MANSYITSTSRFKPYTFAEMLQPVQIYTDTYNEVEDELANLLDIIEKSIPNNTTHQLQVYLTGVQEVMGKMDSHLEQLETRLEQLKSASFSFCSMVTALFCNCHPL